MPTYTGTSANNAWTLVAGGTFSLDGLAGTDTLYMGTSLRSSYKITQGADGSVHVDTLSGASQPAHITLYNMEVLVFNNGRDTLDLTTYFDTTPPAIADFSGASAKGPVAPSSSLVVTFSEPVRLGSGAISLKDAAGKVVQTFDATSAVISGSTLTLKPQAPLNIYTEYSLEMSAGAVNDLAGNALGAAASLKFKTSTVDGLYHFFVVAFAAAPGVTYMGQLADAYNYFSGLPAAAGAKSALEQIVEIFTTKSQFTGVYPTTLSNRELATELVSRIVKSSASEATKASAVDDIEAALGIGWSRGKMLFTVFGNLAAKPLTDPVWGGTAKQFQNELAVARYFTETLAYDTTDLNVLRQVLDSVGPDTDVSGPTQLAQIIGSAVPPPAG